MCPPAFPVDSGEGGSGQPPTIAHATSSKQDLAAGPLSVPPTPRPKQEGVPQSHFLMIS